MFKKKNPGVEFTAVQLGKVFILNWVYSCVQSTVYTVGLVAHSLHLQYVIVHSGN